MDTSLISLECTRQTLAANGITTARLPEAITLLPEHAGQFDCVILEIPKGRKLARRWLVEAHTLLSPSGQLYIAGSNDEGIQTIIKDGQALFGKAVILGYKKGCRVAALTKSSPNPPQPGWVQEAGISPGTWFSFLCPIGSLSFQIHSLPGVFSYDRLDEGTALLLEAFEVPSGSRLLDVGCGYGIIGLVSALKGRPITVDMVDASLLAVASTQQNILQNHLPNTRVLPSDLLSRISDQRYTHILSNPPFHTGKEVDYAVTEALIQQSYQALEPDGQLVIVANQFIHYEHLMEQQFRNVQILAKTSRFHVVAAQKV